MKKKKYLNKAQMTAQSAHIAYDKQFRAQNGVPSVDVAQVLHDCWEKFRTSGRMSIDCHALIEQQHKQQILEQRTRGIASA